MRRFLIAATLAVSLVAGAAGPATAAPPASPTPGPVTEGWSTAGGELTWRSGERVPIGDAAVEFWSGDRRLGRARPHPDGRTFSLALDRPAQLGELTVRAGGRRIDQAPRPRPAAPHPLSRHRPGSRPPPWIPASPVPTGR
ncbi:hypothetical protein GCM10029963_10460 [Micromonospora andamanensis]